MSSVAGQFPLQRWGFVDIFTVMLQFVQLQSWVVAVVDETSEFLWTISASVLVGCSELKGFCLSADVVETSTKMDFKSFYEFLCVTEKMNGYCVLLHQISACKLVLHDQNLSSQTWHIIQNNNI